MKRKLIPLIMIVLTALIASAVLYTLRPLGYNAVSGEPMNIETESPKTPLTEITIWDIRYPVVFEKSLLGADGKIKDVYRVSDPGLARDTYFPEMWVRREDGCILFFEYLHPMKDGKPIDFGATEKDASRRTLLEEQLSPYCDFRSMTPLRFLMPHRTELRVDISGRYPMKAADCRLPLQRTVTYSCIHIPTMFQNQRNAFRLTRRTVNVLSAVHCAVTV